MGASTLLDILGSTIVGGLLLLILLRLNGANAQNTYTNSSELIVQQNLTAVVELLEYDFRKIGYCADFGAIADPSKAIIYADDSRIEFQTDVAQSKANPFGDGVIDTVKYFLGNSPELKTTPNPRDTMLYRVVNHETPKGANMGITLFRLRYYNYLGARLTTPIPTDKLGQIKTIRIDIQIEDVNGYQDVQGDGTQFSSIFWRQIRLVARNLQNR